MFGEENNIYVPNQDRAPPKKQASKRRSLKTSFSELETFSVSVEKNLFADTRIIKIKDNLLCAEGKALRKWRKDNFSKRKAII